MDTNKKLPNGLIAQGVGRLGNNPRVKTFESGSSTCEANVAFHRNYKVNNDWTSQTTWLRVKCWGSQVNEFSKLEKGDVVYFSGSLRQEEWTKGNTKERILVLVVWEFELLKKGGADKSDQTEKPQTTETPLPQENVHQLPPQNVANEINEVLDCVPNDEEVPF